MLGVLEVDAHLEWTRLLLQTDDWEADFWSLAGLSDADINRLKLAHEQVRATAADIKQSN